MQWIPKDKKEPQEQEPVANGIIRTLVSIDKDGIETWKHEPFYTTPSKREWQSLTDDEIKEIIGSYAGPIKGYTRELFDKIEAKLKEKNSG